MIVAQGCNPHAFINGALDDGYITGSQADTLHSEF
jgi:hypothetical protein